MSKFKAIIVVLRRQRGLLMLMRKPFYYTWTIWLEKWVWTFPIKQFKLSNVLGSQILGILEDCKITGLDLQLLCFIWKYFAKIIDKFKILNLQFPLQRIYITISTFTSVHPYGGVSVVRPVTLSNFKFLQSVHKMSVIKVVWHVLRVKYSFWFTLRLLGSMRRGEAELHTLQY